MSIKTILVHVDTTASSGPRLSLAATLARTHDAYLIGVGIQLAGAAEERFQAALAEHQVQGEWRATMDLIELSVGRLACAADLVVIGQPDPDCLLAELTAPEDVILACGRPVLVLPYQGEFSNVGGRVLVAWNGSREATKAVHDALPLMAMRRSSTSSMSTLTPTRTKSSTLILLVIFTGTGSPARRHRSNEIINA